MDRGIVVQSADDPPVVIEVAPGSAVLFGRGHPDAPVDLVLPDTAVSRLAGRITAVEDYWLMSNLSARSTYVIDNPEGGGEFVKVAPRRLDMPVPFEFARVVVPSADRPAVFYVFAPQHLYADRHAQPDGSADATRVAFPLDETAKYFKVLVALCEPRLRDPSSPVIRTVPEILDRLGGRAGLSRSAVNFHIDYLARTKLRVKAAADDEHGRADKADWQRAALVSLALQFDLVREEHLALLPGDCPARQEARTAGARGQ
ncbi:FHA domain-containing protein [Dactylosporangium darangshiense]|uniref:FHA domain-containing protein n=1 Tax=Dactylosporangium darangshiense TaxID=579108 RepID=A0ABP8D826_9ACTN